MATYLRYAADHPGTLPHEETVAPDQIPGDVDYLYRLTLTDDHGVCPPGYRQPKDDQPRGEELLNSPKTTYM